MRSLKVRSDGVCIPSPGFKDQVNRASLNPMTSLLSGSFSEITFFGSSKNSSSSSVSCKNFVNRSKETFAGGRLFLSDKVYKDGQYTSTNYKSANFPND